MVEDNKKQIFSGAAGQNTLTNSGNQYQFDYTGYANNEGTSYGPGMSYLWDLNNVLNWKLCKYSKIFIDEKHI